MNTQQQATWSGHRYLSSHSGWKQPLIKSTLPSMHHYQFVQEVLYQQWFRCHGRWCIVGWTVLPIRHWLRRIRRQHVWWHMNRFQWREWWWWIFWFWINIADFSASYMWVQLQGGLLVLKTVVSYILLWLICEYIRYL